MIKPELLAPAGSLKHFAAAVENGADAIYFGGKLFNARQYADNLEADEILQGIKYAHSKGVKVYMTLNTLIKDEELEDCLKQAGEGADAGVDAFIIQDLGLAAMLMERFPKIPLHLSTQGTTYNSEGVKFAKENGFKRVVLAREMSLDKIRECTAVKGIETEVFVHGALCMCVSGQCAMSSLIGDRSGNRGSCAQPCRMYYSLEDYSGEGIGEKGFLLSPKDISYLGELDKLMEAGVSSLKIEGRIKTPEYVALAVKSFRKYIDEVYSEGALVPVEKKDVDNLQQMFSRGAFTKGYLYGKQNYALLSGESPKHRGMFLGIIKNSKKSKIDRKKSVIEIDAKRDISIGDGIEIIAKGFPGGVVSFIRGKDGNMKKAVNGERVWLGDFPGTIPVGASVYKVTDKELIKEIERSYKGSTLHNVSGNSFGETFDKTDRGLDSKSDDILVTMRFGAAEGQVIRLEVVSEDGRSAAVQGEAAIEAANNRPTDAERVRQQLSKTGNTPFRVKEIDIDMTDNLMIPIAEINKVRRSALEMLKNGK